jgi:hypothetical protein
VSYRQAYLSEETKSIYSKVFRSCYQTTYIIENITPDGSFVELTVVETANRLYRNTFKLRTDIANRFINEAYRYTSIEQLLHQEVEGFADDTNHRPRALLQIM